MTQADRLEQSDTLEQADQLDRADRVSDADRVRADDSAATDSLPGRVSGSPAPEYGEYAPPGWVSPVAATAEPADESGAQELAAPQAGSRVPARPTFDAPPPTGAPVPGPPPAAIRRAGANRLVTMALVAYGLFRVITDAVDSGQFADTFVRQFREMGYLSGTFQSTETLQAVGMISALVAVPLFLLTVAVAFRRLRAGKRSWPVLLIVGAVVNVVTGFLVVGVVMGDPSFAGIPTGL